MMFIKRNNVIYQLCLLVIGTALLMILVIEFILNLTPPIARDALIHHLAVPKLWLKHGGFYELTWANFSYYPMNIDLLYIIPLYFKKDFLANFIHMSFGLGTALLIYTYLKNKISTIAGLLGMLIFLSTPIVVRLSTQAYVDLGMAFFTTASLLAFIRYRDGNFSNFKWLLISALMMGLALGTKYNALIVWFFLSASMIFLYARDTKQQWHALTRGLIFLLVSLLIFSPWLIKNAFLTGNPFYPLFQGIFNVKTLATQEGIYSMVSGQTSRGIFQFREMMYGESIWETLLIPIRYFFQGQDNVHRYFDGVLNPMLIILSPFALMNKALYRDKLFLTSFTVFFLLVATFLDQTRIRYILPVVPILSILTAIGLIHILNWTTGVSATLRILVITLLILICTGLMTQNFIYIKNYYQSISPTNYIIGKESKDQFIARHTIGYEAMKYINTHTPENARIRLILFAGRGYYLDRIYAEGPYYGMSDISGMVANARDEKSFHVYLKSLDCTHLLVRTSLFEKFLQDNYASDIRDLFIKRLNKTTNVIYDHDGCAVYQIVPPS